MTNGQKKLTILLVEDSEADAFFFKRALNKTQAACDLILAQDGKSAISILSDPKVAQSLDLIFLDLKLPYVSGFDVLRWIQSEKAGVPPRVVVLSGSSHIKDKNLAHELGAADYLVKPVSEEMLRRFLAD